MFANAKQESEIHSEMGISMTVYYKGLKQWILLFFLFTIISLPQFAVYIQNQNSFNPLAWHMGVLG